MSTIPKWSIELDEVDSTDTYTTQVIRSATAVSDGTALTVPGGSTATARLHEAIMKAVVAVLNDQSAGN